MSSEVQKGKKRGKTQYVGSAKRHKGGRQLEVGMQGILITCNMNERKCVGEAYSLLNEYGELLYGAEKLGEKDDLASGSEEDEEDDDDVEAALKKEVDQIRTSTEKNLRRFQSVESGANNVVFIKTLNVEPEKLVHHILKDMYTTKKKKTRVILRMLPVTGTCKAFPEDLKKYAETFFEPWFKAPNKGTFQIVYKARNNNHMNRDDVIKDLAGIVGNLNPENKVDLSNPEYTIVVEIIKSVCCLSVVKDYTLFRKYNLQEVVKGTNEETPQQTGNKEIKPQQTGNKEEKPPQPANKEEKPPQPANKDEKPPQPAKKQRGKAAATSK
ncbi:PREDICTED: THUMP domain-containing protein 1 [Nanorana parkeri]|uniref:THUMP domain-containing protein 1 n=1 Tax=Nanorana parkeri TaxID=125878 RepID=UPI000854E87F|nr:PREDICTED: THUMP domain-containing protein 1 [Nanorana parkeri]